MCLLNGTWKRLSYSTAPSLLSLLVKSAYSNPRPLQPEMKLAAINIYLQRRDVRIGEHLNKLDIQKSKEPAEYTYKSWGRGNDNVRPFSIIFESSWWLGRVPENCKKAKTPVLKGDSENYRSVSLISIPEKRRWWRKKRGSHLQTSQGWEDHWKLSAWIYKRDIMLTNLIAW